MAFVAVARNKFVPGYSGPEATAPEVYRIVDLHEALKRVYSTDAHLVTYIVDGAAMQPRINKPGLPYFPKSVSVGVFFCDIDNPGHSAWTDELLETALRQYEELPILQTAGIYHTAHGRRIVQPIATPIPAQDAEPYIRRWLAELEAAGLAVDWACRDWTRHFRLPHVRRGGIPYRSPLVRLECMVPIELDPIVVEASSDSDDDEDDYALGTPLPHVDWSAEVPEVWRDKVAHIAAAIREIKTQWHTLFLALAGSLMSHGAPPEHVPALCRAISLATGTDDKTRDRESAARTTVRRKLAGLHITGHGELGRQWPDVADAVDEALARGSEAHLRAQSAEQVDAAVPAPAESIAALEAMMRALPPGLSVASAECGLGKTRAAIAVAAERAAKSYCSPDAEGTRAPLDSKTSISVDKNALAKQIAQDLAKLGVPVRRIFGPLSVLREDGTPECRYHDHAKPLVAGGQSVYWELCRGRDLEPCQYFDECSAKDGNEGPDDARVSVGPHALLAPLDATAGKTGLVIIDEPPPLVQTEIVSAADIELTRGLLRIFDGCYVGAMTPVLEATRLWLTASREEGVVTTLDAVVRTWAQFVHPDDLDQAKRSSGIDGDAVACGRAAPFPDNRPGTAPPLNSLYIDRAKKDLGWARDVGTASRVMRLLHHALTSAVPVAVRIELRRRKRVLVFSFARMELADALRREGAVLVMDANAALQLPVYEKVVGYVPPHHHFAAPDGAPIERTLLRWRSATRRSWLPKGKLDVNDGLTSALRAVFDWARVDPNTQKLGLITLRPLEVALRLALDPSDAKSLQDWKDLGQSAGALAMVHEELAPMVHAWPGKIIFGHYGATRGLNDWAEVEALATLGDPWPNLGEVRNDVAFLGLGDDWEGRAEAMCRAELEQAHGRLRVVHRKRAGRALHVGAVLPSGWGWTHGDVQVRRRATGGTGAMTPAELKDAVAALGGVRATARVLGCAHRLVQTYLAGTCAIPAEKALVLTNTCASLDAQRMRTEMGMAKFPYL